MNEYYKNLLNSIPDIVNEIDKDGILKYVNESIYKLGYTQEELIGKHFSAIIHPDDIQIVQRAYIIDGKKNNDFNNGQPKLFDERRTGERITKNLKIRLLPKKNSNNNWIIHEGEVIATGFYKYTQENKNKFLGTIGIVRDLSEVQRSEKALIQTEKHYRLLMENSSDIISIIANDGTILYKSNSVEKNIGYNPIDIIGENELDYIHPEERDLLANILKEKTDLLKDNIFLEFRYRSKDNKWIYLETTITSIINPSNNVMCYVLNSRNITRRKIAEDEKMAALKEVKKARDLAERANLAKSQFLAKMSHEIRTPMNAVIGITDLLLSSNSNLEHRKYLETLKDSANLLLQIINDILDISKIESGLVGYDKQKFNLYETVSDVIIQFNEIAIEKQLDFKVTLSERIPPFCIGDKRKITQVLLNLISNSFKFTTEGYIHLNVNLYKNNNKKNNANINMIEFSVTDSGIGIPEKFYDKIFYDFYQIDSSLTRNFGGTGLGLAISKSLVELMDGTITLTGNKNSGSIFSFVIPLELIYKENAIDDIEEKHIVEINDNITKKEILNFSEYKILVVEDNATNLMLFEALLYKKGYQVVSAVNGKEAIEKVESDHFDIILMDIEMPIMDGIEATHTIRSKPEYCNIPIIALTAHALKGDKERFLNAGVDEYISKPINAKNFFAVLKKHLLKTQNVH